MNLAFKTSNHRASCSVYSHREIPQSTHFANIHVEARTKKRPRARGSDSFPENSRCRVNVSVWEISKSFSLQSLASTLSHVYNFCHHFTSWNDAKIIAIDDVSHFSNFTRSTYFALVLFGDDNRYGTVMGVIHESETIMLPITIHDKEPISAAILRGPSLLCVPSPGSIILERDREKCDVHGFDFVNARETMTAICTVEDDRYALLSFATTKSNSPCAVQVYSVHWKAKATKLFTVDDVFDSGATLLAASLQYRLLFFSTVDGVVHAMDMVSRASLWRTRKQRDILKQVKKAVLHNGLLVLSTLNEAEDFYAAHAVVPENSSYDLGDVNKLFSTRCDQAKENKHVHLYISWQKLLLKVDSETGACCDEEDSHETVGFSINSRNPSMLQIENHLAGRLEKGLDQFLEDMERTDDLKRMKENVRSLLRAGLEHSDSEPLAPIFGDKVTCFASVLSPDIQHDSQVSNDSITERDIGNSQISAANDPTHLVTSFDVVQTNCELDRLRSLVFIEVQIALNPFPREEDTKETKDLRAKLMLHTNDRIPFVWSCNEVSLNEKSDSHTLLAVCPLAVFTNSSTLPNMTFTAAITMSNNHSIPVGLFTLASFLHTPKENDRCNNICTRELFNSEYHVMISGGDQSRLRNLLLEEDIAPYVKFVIEEDKTRLCITPVSQSELSTLLARITIRAEDKITFQSVPEPSKRSLYEVDNGVILLEEEQKMMQNISSQKNAFGYTAEEVIKVIEKQIEVDDTFGMIEEQLLWF